MIKKVLVTGGAGYIGSHTVRLLLKQKYDVVVLDNLCTGHRESLPKDIVFENVDLKDKDEILNVFQKHQPDAVIDFAAYALVGESMEDPDKYLENNVYNFLNLLEVMQETGCKYLIKSSTCALYGSPEDKDFPVSEDYYKRHHFSKSHLLEANYHGKSLSGEQLFQEVISSISRKLPKELQFSNCELGYLRISTSIYGLTKMADEILMKKFYKKYKINSVALRYFNACGADDLGDIGEDHDPENHLIPNVIKTALGINSTFTLNGTDYPTPDGTVIRDYVHVNDLADNHITALLYLIENHGFTAINLGNGNGYSCLDIIKETEKQAKHKIDIITGLRRSGDAIKIYGNIGKAKELLGFKPKYDLTKIISTALNWHRSNPKGFDSQKSKV
jgi:UDP-glucose 4-epimerase